MMWQQEAARLAAQPLFRAAAWTVASALLLGAAVGFGRIAARRWGEARALGAELAEARALLPHAAEEQRTADDAEASARTVQDRLRAGRSTARVLELLGEAASLRHLQLHAVQPEAGDQAPEPVPVGRYLTLERARLTLTVEGGYRALGEFLESLAALPVLATVETLTVRTTEGGAGVAAEIALGVYASP